MSNKEIIVLEKECSLCGKTFEVKIDKQTKRILSKVFYGGKIRFGVGMWSCSRLETDASGKPKWVKIHPFYREFWYRMIDFFKTVFHRYKDVEYWECEKCLRSWKKTKQTKKTEVYK